MKRNSVQLLACYWMRAACFALCLLAGLPRAQSSTLGLDFAKGSPMIYFTDADKALQRDAALYVLEQPQSNIVKEWHNPLTGFGGRIEGRGDWLTEQGDKCRKIKITSRAKGAESAYVFPLCRRADGEWLIGSGLKLRPADDEAAASF